MQRRVVQSEAQAHTRFRADIEGLRGVAVLGVVTFHAFPRLLPGGYVGVDVFFVISGYLITKILVSELDATGRISLSEFWARRARRIIPAASLVLIATVVAATALNPPINFVEAGRDVQAAGAFVENWLLIANAIDYWKQDLNPSLVLHYWSLSVEEQYYLVWPLLLLLAAFATRAVARFGIQRALLATVICVWLISFGLNIYFTAELPPFAFFSTGTRVWQLASGAMLAIVITGPISLPRRLATFLHVAAMVALLAIMLLITRRTPYPGWIALVPTLATCGLIAFGTAGSARLLAQPPLTYIGRVSYSWYLWHWPFLILGGLALGGADIVERGLLVLASLILGVASYHFVETPVRFSPRLVGSPRLSLLLGLLLTGLSIGAGYALATYKAGGLIVLSDGTVLTEKAINRDRTVIYNNDCHLGHTSTRTVGCIYGDKSSKRSSFFLETSTQHITSQHWRTQPKTAGWKLLSRTKTGCPSVDIPVWSNSLGRAYRECSEWRDNVLDEIRAVRPALVVLANASETVVDRERGAHPIQGFHRRQGGRRAQNDRQAPLERCVDHCYPRYATPTCIVPFYA